MRNLGGFLMFVGLFGFVYCTIERGKHEPVPAWVETMDALKYPAGRYDVGRYVAAVAGGVGVLLALFPKGR